MKNFYNEDYFSGITSGYPDSYDKIHATWVHWIRFIEKYHCPHIKLLDVGCAYGYLVKEATDLGLEAYGVDVSIYALSRLLEMKGKILASEAEKLPFPDETFDVITAFDLVEHLIDPISGLKEMTRVLKDKGWLVLGTPDPIHFTRNEQTHFSEHPPSYWVNHLKELGYDLGIRFPYYVYNLEILGIKAQDQKDNKDIFKRLKIDGLTEIEEICTFSGPDFYAALRGDWQPLRSFTENGPLRLLKEKGLVYLLNAGKLPQRLKIRFVCSLEFAPGPIKVYITLKEHLLWSGLVSTEMELIDLDIMIPPGGHDLVLQSLEESLAVKSIHIEAFPVKEREYNLELPFDQYQRYRIAKDQINTLFSSGGRKKILDVGGEPGLAATFFPEDDYIIVNLSYADHPSFLTVKGIKIPLEDESNDIVLCIDVLEYIKPHQRKEFLTELWRVCKKTLLLATPFESQAVKQAESVLFEFIKLKTGQEHHFLKEHKENGLPVLEEVISHLENLGASCQVFPNGFLSNWLAMMLINFYLLSQEGTDKLFRALNRYYNENYYTHDNAYPCYRHLIVAEKRPLSADRRPSLNTTDNGLPTADMATLDLKKISSILNLLHTEELKALLEHNPRVEIVIPVYNEGKRLRNSISTLVKFLSNRFNYHWDITIADNGSTDHTLDIAKELSLEFKGVNYLHMDEKGRGRALKKAWASSSADIVCYMDVDLSTNLIFFPLLIEGILCGYDLAVGSRLMQASRTTRSIKREILSRGLNRIIKCMFFNKFSDAQCGFKAIRKDVFSKLVPNIKNDTWFFDTELLLVSEKNNFKIFEAPVEWIEDLDSRVKIMDAMMEDLKGLMRMRFSRLKIR